MTPTEPSYSTTAGPKYSNIAENKEKDLKNNHLKMIEVPKDEMLSPVMISRKMKSNNERKTKENSKK